MDNHSKGEIPDPAYVLSAEEISRMRGSLVYVRRRISDGRALYVGASTEGLGRPLQNLNYKAHVAEGEVLEIYLTDRPMELEDRLIRHERPELNAERKPVRSPDGSCAACGVPMSLRHKARTYCGPRCEKRFKDREREEMLISQAKRQAAAQALADRADSNRRQRELIKALAEETGVRLEDSP